MPLVAGKKYPYTNKGISAAKKARKKKHIGGAVVVGAKKGKK